MAEAMLIGAGIGAGTSMLSGNDPLKGAALGGAMGGASAGFGSAGVASGAGAEGVASTVPSHLTSDAVSSTVANNTMNPALTNGLGESSNMLTQFGRDASDMATNAYNTVGDTVGQGFDYINDMTGMENKDWTQMAMAQGISSMQPDPQQPIQAAPMGQGISRPNVDLSQSQGSLLSSNPITSGAGGQQLTPEQLQKLKQQGLL
jgi:hypothetical protein